MPASTSPETLPPFADAKAINVIVETPAGSRCKLKYDAKSGRFSIGSYLPQGFSFPFDFGFIPGTRGGDGDPLDVLLIAEGGTAVACLVPARLIGALLVEQSEDGGKPVRNDRLLAVPVASRVYEKLTQIGKLPPALREQIEYFLSTYGRLAGKSVSIVGHRDARAAQRLVRQAVDKDAQGKQAGAAAL